VNDAGKKKNWGSARLDVLIFLLINFSGDQSRERARHRAGRAAKPSRSSRLVWIKKPRELGHTDSNITKHQTMTQNLSERRGGKE
jgi:hypothetical protein